jgi:hypothetical protein
LNVVLVIWNWTQVLERLVSLMKWLVLSRVFTNFCHAKRVIFLYLLHRRLINLLPLTLWGDIFLNIGALVKKHSLHILPFSCSHMRARHIWYICFEIIFILFNERLLFVLTFINNFNSYLRYFAVRICLELFKCSLVILIFYLF